MFKSEGLFSVDAWLASIGLYLICDAYSLKVLIFENVPINQESVGFIILLAVGMTIDPHINPLIELNLFPFVHVWIGTIIINQLRLHILNL